MTELSPRETARAAGEIRYWPDAPCIHGHAAERYTAEGTCVECRRLKNMRPESKAARARWESGQTLAAQQRKRYSSQRAKAKAKGYAKAPHERHCPPRPEDNRCERCMNVPTHTLCQDHDHKTGAFRGYICIPCNTKIEHHVDDPLTLAYFVMAARRVHCEPSDHHAPRPSP